MARGEMVQWTDYMFRGAWTGISGEWCDIWLGLVVIPVGRNSLIAKTFQIQPSTLLQAHRILAYGLLTFGLVHGLVYCVCSSTYTVYQMGPVHFD